MLRWQTAKPEEYVDSGHGKKTGIEAIEPAAVTGKRGAGVFDACAALESGLDEVAHLSGGVTGDSDESGDRERDIRE